MKPYILSPEAERDLAEIVHYVWGDSRRAAMKLADEMRVAMRKLAAMPTLGHRRPDLTDEPVRFWKVRSWLIIYHERLKPLSIARILHGARDVKTLLKP